MGEQLLLQLLDLLRHELDQLLDLLELLRQELNQLLQLVELLRHELKQLLELLKLLLLKNMLVLLQLLLQLLHPVRRGLLNERLRGDQLTTVRRESPRIGLLPELAGSDPWRSNHRTSSL